MLPFVFKPCRNLHGRIFFSKKNPFLSTFSQAPIMTESCLSSKLNSSAQLSTCLCTKCLWKNICGKEGKKKKQREKLVSAGLLPLLLLESSLEKTERDGEKGTDWISWGKMLREPEFSINQLIYGSKSAVEAVASTGSRFSSLTPPLHPPSPPTATWWSWPLTSAETGTASKVWRVSFFSTSSVAREERKWAFLLLEVWNYYFPRLPNSESRMSLLFLQVEIQTVVSRFVVLIFSSSISLSQGKINV